MCQALATYYYYKGRQRRYRIPLSIPVLVNHSKNWPGCRPLLLPEMPLPADLTPVNDLSDISALKSVSFTGFLLNVNGLLSKKNRIFSLMYDMEPDIVVINEVRAKLEADVPEASGYTVVVDVRQESASGGVAVYVKHGIPVRKVDVTKHQAYEVVWISVGDETTPMIVVAPYIRPTLTEQERGSVFDHLHSNMLTLLDNGASIVLAGDLNAHIGSDPQGIPGNTHDEIGGNGQYVRDLVKNLNGNVWNKWPDAKGLVTRKGYRNQKDSILDYLFILFYLTGTPRRVTAIHGSLCENPGENSPLWEEKPESFHRYTHINITICSIHIIK